MDPITLGILGGNMGLQAIGGLIAGSSRRRAEQEAARRLAALENELYGGMVVPEAEVAQTAYEGVAPDAQSVAAQRAALMRLQEISGAGGLTMEDRAALAQIQAEQDSTARGSREALLQNARQRGSMQSGQLLGAQMAAEQDAANAARMQGLQVGGMAQRRALETLMQGANLASGMRQQGFDEQSRVASARDAIRAFNAAQRQQRFGNKMGLADARASLRTGGIQQQRQADLTGGQTLGALMGGLNDAATTAAMYSASQKKAPVATPNPVMSPLRAYGK